VLTGFEKYVFTDGTVNNADGDPLVDDLYYYSRTRCVERARRCRHALPHHRLARGARSGCVLLDLDYLSMHPDVKAASVDPLVQFDHAGWKTGADPSIAFDTNAYLAVNPDVKAAGADPLEHFLSKRRAGRPQPIAPSVLLAANGFDYVYSCSTIRTWRGARRSVRALRDDRLEGRPQSERRLRHRRIPCGPMPMSRRRASIRSITTTQSGWKEGRDPSVNFDTTDYLGHYTDVAKRTSIR